MNKATKALTPLYMSMKQSGKFTYIRRSEEKTGWKNDAYIDFKFDRAIYRIVYFGLSSQITLYRVHRSGNKVYDKIITNLHEPYTINQILTNIRLYSS